MYVYGKRYSAGPRNAQIGTFSLRSKRLGVKPPLAEDLIPAIDYYPVKATAALKHLRPGDDVLYRLESDDDGKAVAVFVRKFDPASDSYESESVRSWSAGGGPGTGKRR
jgi:hypothetical protein